jgi:hypothetical protein
VLTYGSSSAYFEFSSNGVPVVLVALQRRIVVVLQQRFIRVTVPCKCLLQDQKTVYYG